MHNNLSRRGFLGLAAMVSLAACSKPAPEEKSEEQRVVALNTGQLDNLLSLGIVPVGVAAAKGAELIPQFIRDEFGARYDLDSIANCGLRQSPDLEAIAKLNPTLICANKRAEEQTLNQLREIATVVTGEGGGENWKNDLMTIAEAAHKSDEAKKLFDEYETATAEFKKDLGQQPPTVSFLRTKDGGFQIYGANSMAGTVAADCGLARPESQQFTNKAGEDISAEVLDKADADWIFYAVQSGADSPVNSPLWGSLTGQAVEVDYDAWYVNASLLSATIIQKGLRKSILG